MKNILIIDIETTGFKHRNDYIVEVGIIELDLDSGNKKIIFDKTIKEKGLTKEYFNNSWICQNGYISYKDIENSKSFDNFKNEIQTIIDSYPLGTTAYNNKFDFGFLESREIKFTKKLDCPMLLSTDVCKLPGRYGYKWPNVEEAYKHYFPEIEYIEKHRGADDAMHEAEIVFELYKLGIFKV